MNTAAFQAGVTLCLLIVTAGWTNSAQAHEGTDTSHSGVLHVPSFGTAAVPVEGCKPGDTMQWTWGVATAYASTVSAKLLWTDTSGQEHTAPAEQAGQTFGTFVAPQDFANARLVWTNSNDTPAEIDWSYGAEAPFWRRPEMFLPAMIPILLIPVAYLLGRYVDRRRSKSAVS
ncbi:MAG: hypothetical protein AAB538_06165 [Patescibacteria group bacterium]